MTIEASLVVWVESMYTFGCSDDPRFLNKSVEQSGNEAELFGEDGTLRNTIGCGYFSAFVVEQQTYIGIF